MNSNNLTNTIKKAQVLYIGMGKNCDIKVRLKGYIQLIAGAALMSVAYKCVYEQAGMVTGGFSGICVIVKGLTKGIIRDGLPLWITNAVLNVPLFIAAYIIMGKDFVKRTIAGAALLSFFLAILPDINIEETDYLITALLGGGLCGSGVGLVLLSGASTGGTDMLAVLLHKYLKNYSVIQIMQYLDALIVAAGAAVFGIYVSLYAIIAIYITTVISDNILEGTKHGVAVFVITDNYEIIADIIKRDMNRGVTLIKGQGMYSYKPKNMLLCVVSRKEISQLKQICVEKDRESFILSSDVREVMGEGFVQNIQ